MKSNKTQQEIVLITNTTFFKREWCKAEVSESNPQTYVEQLEEACWNGLLSDMLPEVIKPAAGGKHLCLWHIRRGASFLKIELSETPPHLDEFYSIDAAFFLPMLGRN